MKAIKAGADGYVLKSNFVRLASVVDRELRASQGRREHRRAREQLALQSVALAERTLELRASRIASSRSSPLSRRTISPHLYA